MLITPPSPQSEKPGGTLRFAIGDPSSFRSNTWSVVGSKNSSDVYISARTTMSEVKLSLHASQRWRLALTEQEALRRELGDADRVFVRWAGPAPSADGWQHAATICIPSSSVLPAWPEPKVKKGRISFWPVPAGIREFRFDVLIREANAENITINETIGEVGRIRLGDGGDIWVIASEFEIDEERVIWIERLRDQTRRAYVEKNGSEAATGPNHRPTGAAWGFAHEDGRPVIVDLGDLSPGR